MQVSFSMYSNKNDSEPIRQIIKRLAQEYGVSEGMVALLMSSFLEHLAAKVASGVAVSIVGFGIFGPARWQSRRDTEVGWAVPRFYPSRGFRNEVRMCCSAYPSAEQKLRNYRKNHHRSRKPTPDDSRACSMVFTAQEKFRKDIRAEYERYGLDPMDIS